MHGGLIAAIVILSVLALVGIVAIAWLAFALVTTRSMFEKPISDAQLLVDKQVDLQQYAGTWFEVARLPNLFEKGCACATATYTPRADGNSVQVVNQCINAAGTVVNKVEGAAWPVNAQNSALRVSFAPGFLQSPLLAGDYWILDLDDTYNNALVGSPDRKFLWFLSRERQMDDATFDRFQQRAQSLGFPTDKLLINQC